MNYGKPTCILILVTILEFALVSGCHARGRHPPGRGSDDHDHHGKRAPAGSVQAVQTCLGEPVNFQTQIDVAKVEECLDRRLSDFYEMYERRSENWKSKRTRKLNTRCTPECEWRSFNVVSSFILLPVTL